MDVRAATTPADLDEARRLFRAFVSWHRERHVDDRDLIDAYFDDAAFERELAGLPGAYAEPDGSLLLAWEDDRALGCVASRRLADATCEMKRMFVDPAGRHRGVGTALGEAVVAQARSAGYRAMYLDTSVRQGEAMALYRRLGFVEVEPYYALPPPLRDWLVFFRLAW
ncbi:GNAT family N-acetyltransferase [Mumia sp. DW29H23]|uniref:GNAT family N-acetyltransferase n=1 Tax=Mumia sp. DW29H23 TaxID=3421241 RepID=UPI003D69BA48